ncbi:MAG: hypothetical protein ACRC1F_01765, partial [Metamycoplasmataceae bacterium]
DSDLQNLDVILNQPIAASDKYTITLKAKDGYTINGQQIIVSNPFDVLTAIPITIRQNPTPTKPFTIPFNESNIEDIDFIKKFFDINSLENYDIIEKVNKHGNDQSFVIELSAKNGYIFNVGGSPQKTINSMFYKRVLNIASKTITEIIFESELEIIANITMDTLNKLFEGSDLVAAFDNKYLEFRRKISPSLQLELTTNNNKQYIFDNTGTLQSKTKITSETITIEPLIELNILQITPTIDKFLLSEVDINSPTFLNKLFSGIIDLNNFKVEEKKNGQSFVITLKANADYGFNVNGTLEKEISSIPYQKIIDIDAKFLIDPIYQSDLDVITLNTLKKLFIGNDLDSAFEKGYFTIELISTGSGSAIKLKTGDGYIFKNRTINLRSINFTVDTTPTPPIVPPIIKRYKK